MQHSFHLLSALLNFKYGGQQVQSKAVSITHSFQCVAWYNGNLVNDSLLPQL